MVDFELGDQAISSTRNSDDEGSSPSGESSLMEISISRQGKVWDLSFPPDATITHLFEDIEHIFGIPINNQKIMAPKTPLLKAPLKDPDMPLSGFVGKKLVLIGSTAQDSATVELMAKKVAEVNAARLAYSRTARRVNRLGIQRSSVEASKYTFLEVRPLLGLPHPERSQMVLMRLKNDPGIVAAMKKHKFTVLLLTEMEPLANTQSTHEGTTRLLGLNRNKGEAIELRLRTDAHDGYRDYKTIRKTLCHELAHNVHGPHDRQFWDLCHQIEREVEAADWKSGGRTVGEATHYTASAAAEEEDFPEDEGGWTGGEFVLGGVSDTASGMTRREILERAVMNRMQRETDTKREGVEGSKKRPGPPAGSDDSK